MSILISVCHCADTDARKEENEKGRVTSTKRDEFAGEPLGSFIMVFDNLFFNYIFYFGRGTERWNIFDKGEFYRL